MIKSQNKRGEFTLRPHEVERLWNACDNTRDRLIIKTLYFCGLRRFELTALNASDIDFEKNLLVVREGKGKKMRTVPLLDPSHAAELRIHLGGRREGAVFYTRLGARMGNKSVNNLLAVAAKRAKLNHPNPGQKQINPHLLRHSIARFLKSIGMTAEFIQKFLGHTSIMTTMDTYGTLSIDEMQLMLHRKLGVALPSHLEVGDKEMRRLE